MGLKEVTTDRIFEILKEILYGYGTLYMKADYSILIKKVLELVHQNKKLKFLLPAFPAKSSNFEEKVLGISPDFGECFAIRTLLTCARKLQAIYDYGVVFIIMADYHTFDKIIGVSEESYRQYHDDLDTIINQLGASDVVELISLKSFTPMKDIPEPEISDTLALNYGGVEKWEDIRSDIKQKSPEPLRRYTQMKKFLDKDLKPQLKKSPKAQRRSKLSDAATGMMSQGFALDNFLKKQTDIIDYIRITIHNHDPKDGKFAVNLFKEIGKSTEMQIKTPWHNVVVFDTLTCTWEVANRDAIISKASSIESSSLNLVYHDGKPWLYIILYTMHPVEEVNAEHIKINLLLPMSGLLIESKNRKILSTCFDPETIRNLIKEFGVVIFRGFKKFEDEIEALNAYSVISTQGMVKWDFGFNHIVSPTNKDRSGDVCTNSGLPIHWDFIFPPAYMKIDQSKYDYEDFTSPYFFLYSRHVADQADQNNGPTTIIDAKAAVLSLDGKKIEEYKSTVLKYEAVLSKVDGGKLPEWFGGKANYYRYPLVMKCPGENFDVLRWHEYWSEEKDENIKQNIIYDIVSSSSSSSVEDLENEMKKIAFDERWCFYHQYQQGDQVHINNYTMLHGRPAFKYSNRELWRFQALPVTENLPDYFKNT